MPNCEKISTPLMPDRITNDRPLVSVIIPTYNRARDLKEAVDSVLRQTYQNIEIIVVDDGSTDETHEIMNSFTDQRIKYIKKKNERHPGKTRNVGLQAAKGEYIAFLDDDDLWLPEKLEIQMAEMRKQPQYAWSYTHYKIFGTGESREYHIPPRQRNISGRILESLARFGSFLATPTICVKREVFDKTGGFAEIPELRSGQDFDLWLRIACKFEVLCIPQQLVLVRFQGKSTSETFIPGRSFALYERNIKDAPLPASLKKYWLSNSYLTEAEYKLSHALPGFRKDFRKALTLYPFMPARWIIFPILLLPASWARTLYFKLKTLQKTLFQRS